jgi:ADP-heptose:LPS heptosyltransferase
VAQRDVTKGFDAPPQRVAVFRALALGDLLCAVPSLRAFRRAWPKAEITLVGLPWARKLARRFTAYIDRFIEFPGWPGLPERKPLLSEIPEFLAAMQRERFDLAIQLHGSGTIVNSLVALFGAHRTAGFFPPGYFCPDPTTFASWPENGLEIHRLLSLVDFLGLPRHGDELEFPLDESDYRRLDALLPSADRPLAVVHPGASVTARQWPAERFTAVADKLANAGFAIVLTGVAGERITVERVASNMRHEVLDLCSLTDLGALGALVSRAQLLICNDTGISHIAAALQTPSVVISTGDNPARWAPINRRLHRVLCHPVGVAPDDAIEAAMQLAHKFAFSSPQRIGRPESLIAL